MYNREQLHKEAQEVLAKLKAKPYSVYQVELHPSVWDDHKFKTRNHTASKTKPAYYVGATGLDPKVRFAKHKNGEKYNKYVRNFGLHVQPVSKHDTWTEASKAEQALAVHLKSKGHGVKQG